MPHLRAAEAFPSRSLDIRGMAASAASATPTTPPSFCKSSRRWASSSRSTGRVSTRWASRRSAGGVMSHALGCAAADTFAAIAAIDGPFEVKGRLHAVAADARAALAWHARQGLPVSRDPRLQRSAADQWQCKDEPTNTTQSRRVTVHTCTEYTASEVQLATMHGETHVLSRSRRADGSSFHGTFSSGGRPRARRW